MFKGSKNVEPEEHASMLASIGGQSNAYTNDDATVFWQTVPSQYLPLVLWMEADRMATLRIDKTTFENEREVVKEERRLRVDNQPFGRLSEILYDTFYTVSPYKHTTIGSMKDLDAASVEDVRDFHNTFYVPHNATIAIVGDFDMAQAKELVTKYFGRIPKSDRVITREYPREKPSTAERRVTVNEAWPLPAVIVAYPITFDGNPDSYPLHLTSKILSDGDSSRIYQSLVYEKGIALSAFGGGQHHRGAEPVLRGGARGAGAHARRGRKGADRRVRQAAHRADLRARAAARQEPVLPRLHRRSRVDSREGQPARACRCDSRRRHDGRRRSGDFHEHEGVRSASRGENLFHAREPPRAEDSPEGHALMLRRAFLASILALGAPAVAAVGAQVSELAVGKSAAAAAVEAGQLPALRAPTLPNGMQVIVVMHHEQPEVTMRLLVRAGAAYDPPGKGGTAALVASLLEPGHDDA